MSANARCHHDSGGDPLTGDSLPEEYKVFNFDTKDEREKAWAAKLLAGGNISHCFSFKTNILFHQVLEEVRTSVTH